ncbi:hypothetical protein DTO166G4_6491 [Paecilomyces variotii]|uniref:Xylose isomerase-like protein n=1 Tax=Byssochlamys spectabilis TaxID=264951 RepID=A0A443HU38_BYSSP|nr:xylose isomerase-like protein [Paecilomyces variotii]KAJ9192842.1 hypothetical protein DTO032I3_8078 [Paecilomyces variotii]KAJ9193164.1 hypothetical protein DTO164E3_7988 [Paecilomyces variotii]KAJ9211963.1 hypothetical protein DTO166G4_6491 [Paecilomyces variotii]KAJ9231944.1 hypothetical protein DTO166G5_6475 [Paecilomyces variotii]KAJ9240950.1 hypothetical protein DTO169E5_3867 [Paecilomyces variotii]
MSSFDGQASLPSPPPSEPEVHTSFRPAIATISVGAPDIHPLKKKLDVISTNGFSGIELFYDDLHQVAKELQRRDSRTPVDTSQQDNNTTDYYDIKAAFQIKNMCEQRGLQIVSLQPFRNYEGLLCKDEQARRIKELQHWTKLATILGNDVFILIPSSFLGKDEAAGDKERLVEDLTLAAEIAHPVRLAYEALAWGTHVNRWEESWDIVQRVNRKNFGICFDTFNIAAGVWADPTTVSGRSSEEADQMLQQSLQRLMSDVDPDRVFCIQLADGERVDPSAAFLHIPNQPTLLGWSRNSRLFPFEEDRGGYLPILEIARAVTSGIGFSGWVSMEIFSRTTRDDSPMVPSEHAARAASSWDKTIKSLEETSLRKCP